MDVLTLLNIIHFVAQQELKQSHQYPESVDGRQARLG